MAGSDGRPKIHRGADFPSDWQKSDFLGSFFRKEGLYKIRDLRFYAWSSDQPGKNYTFGKISSNPVQQDRSDVATVATDYLASLGNVVFRRACEPNYQTTKTAAMTISTMPTVASGTMPSM